MGSNLTSVKSQAGNLYQPMRSSSHSCTLLMVENLALPEWLSVNCHHLLLNVVLCSSNASTHLNRSYIELNETDHSLYCQKNEIKYINECISAKLVSLSQSHTVCAGPDITAKPFHYFLKIFNKETNVPTLFITKVNETQCQEVSLYLTEYVNMTLRVKEKPCAKCHGITFCQQSQFSHCGPSMVYIFACSSSAMISQMQVCNGHDDCLDRKDELMCDCKTKENNKNSFCVISKTFKEFASEISFTVFANQLPKADNSKDEFLCTAKKAIPMRYVNDGYPDCPDSEDEQSTKHSMLENILAKTLCKNPLHIQCYEGYHRCFPIQKLCFHEVDSTGKSSICRNGHHLTYCEHFQCNNAFKCPQTYCIPYKYQCDGKWECINGADELNCELSGERCFGMFKCANSSVCITVINVCDQEHDCPFGTDEAFCVPRDARCPPGCHCFLFAASCSGEIGMRYFLNMKTLLNFWTHLSFQKIKPSKRDLKDLQNATTMVILQSDMRAFCQTVNISLPNLKLVRLQEGSLDYLADYCFGDMNNIVKMNLNHLGLTDLGMLSFHDQQKLEYLDASYNMLRELKATTFLYLHSLKQLNIQNNNLIKISLDLFEGLSKISKIQTDYFAVCCSIMTQTSIACSAKAEWPFSCNDILTKAMYIFFVAFCNYCCVFQSHCFVIHCYHTCIL